MSEEDTEKTVTSNNLWHDNIGCPLMVIAFCAMLAFIVHSCNEYKTAKKQACDCECSCAEENP